MQHIITQILSFRSMGINDSDVQGRIVRERDCEVRPLKERLQWREEEQGFSRSVWPPADTNMALSVLCQSDINQS